MGLLLLLLACAPGTDPAGDASSVASTAGTSATTPPPPAPEVTIEGTSVLDPVLGGAGAWTVRAVGSGTLVAQLRDPEGLPVAAADAEVVEGGAVELAWDGRVDGEPALGAFTVAATLVTEDGEAVEADWSVRSLHAGFDAAWAEDDGGVDALRVPLYWHVARQLQDPAEPFSVLLDPVAGGDLPPVSDDLRNPPTPGEGAEPLAWRWDSRPLLSLEPVLLEADGLEIDVQAPGWTVLDGAPLAEGTPLLLQRDAPIAEGLGVHEEELRLLLSVGGESLGEAVVPLRHYALLDAPAFLQEGPRYHPWVAAIDPALRALQDLPPDAGLLRDALVDWVFHEHGIVYDTDYGASAYIHWPAFGWEGEFDLSAYLDRRYGTVVNCSDCAGILSTWSNMLGAFLDTLIVLEDFQLNQILAIGQSEFTNCPFGPRGCGFSYHAVTSSDGGDTIWDATLALDGDGDPAHAPSTVWQVQSVPGDDYLDALVLSGRAYYAVEFQGTIR